MSALTLTIQPEPAAHSREEDAAGPVPSNAVHRTGQETASMSSTTTTHNPASGASVVESAARAAFTGKYPGRSWESAPAWQRDRFRLVERQRAGVADDE